MFRSISYTLGVLAMLVAISCDRVPLLAPTNSSVTIDAGSRVVATGGSTSVTATVIESGGTPVQNGTTVRFTTSLGRVEPAEAQTRNGIATTTFFAGDDSGVAEVRATSGGAGGSTTTPGTGTTPGTTTTTNSNVVQIAVGAGAVDTVTVSANPSTVSRTRNNDVAVTATVVGTGGRLLSGVPVNFSANRGTFSANSAVTDSQGQARVTLTTNNDTTVTAVAGTKTATATITGQDGPSVTLACAVGTTQNCANVNQGQSVTFTAQRGGATSTIVSSSLDFGDNTSTVSLGSLASATTVPHVYSAAGTYTARLSATDVNGETTTDTEIIQVLAPATASVTATVTAGQTVQATATTSVSATQYAWTFEGTTVTQTTSSNVASHTYATSGTKTISVTVTLTDGRTVTASTQVAVP